MFSLIFELENFCLQRLASGLENSVLKSFVAKTDVFDFVEVLLGKLLHRVLAGNVFKQTHLTCLSSWIEFKSCGGTGLFCDIILIVNRILKQFGKTTRRSSSFLVSGVIVD